MPESPRRRHLDVADYIRGVRAGDRAILARAVSLIESEAPRHRPMAHAVIEGVLPFTGTARRVGITGVPGVGKSTLIEALGMQIVEAGHRVAVLAIDPSSRATRGSILGDKTRMANLAADERAYIRPSPTSGSLGGVTRKTRETILLCEAAGYDVVLVETVGVGQSETLVAEMVDTMVVLMLAGAGDDLQGIKRGILEVADVLAINKADGPMATRVKVARRELATALELMRRPEADWVPPVLTCSGLQGDGLEALWAAADAHLAAMMAGGGFERRRAQQRVNWLWSAVEDGLMAAFHDAPKVAAQIGAAEHAVREGAASPSRMAERLLAAFVTPS